MTLTHSIARALGPGHHSDPKHLVEVHVSSEKLGAAEGTERPEGQLYRALEHYEGRPARVLVHGEAGSGKTSLILRGVGEATASQPPLEVLVLRCGEDPSRLASSTAFVRYVVNTLLNQKGFATVDAEQLARAAAIREDHGTPVETSSGEVGGGALPFTYRFEWQGAVESFSTEPSEEHRRHILIDQINAAASERRLVIVLDDTDKFAALRADGSIDTDSISNLFLYGVSFLLELPVSIIVAVHPTYRDIPALRQVSARGGFVHVDVPHLPSDVSPPPLAMIIDRRLQVAGHEACANYLFHPDALAQLQATYFEEKRRNLRTVLRLCQASATRAADDNSERVTILHVQAALEELTPES